MDKISGTFNDDGLTSTDQMGRQVTLPARPERILSLVPSITEYLFDLGLGDKIVGRTKFCCHPAEKVRKVPKTGGTKQFDFGKINQLKPDLIIGNKEENYKKGIDKLSDCYPVWMSDVQSLDENFEMMETLGSITGCHYEAASWISRIRKNFKRYYKKYSGKVLYLIWRHPYMVAGKDTFINHILEYLGYENIVLQKRYPEMDTYILKQLKTDQVFLSSEPFPFKEKHINEFKMLFPSAKTRLVDGEAFSWYGSRLAKVSFDFG